MNNGLNEHQSTNIISSSQTGSTLDMDVDGAVGRHKYQFFDNKTLPAELLSRFIRRPTVNINNLKRGLVAHLHDVILDVREATPTVASRQSFVARFDVMIYIDVTCRLMTSCIANKYLRGDRSSVTS